MIDSGDVFLRSGTWPPNRSRVARTGSRACQYLGNFVGRNVQSRAEGRHDQRSDYCEPGVSGVARADLLDAGNTDTDWYRAIGADLLSALTLLSSSTFRLFAHRNSSISTSISRRWAYPETGVGSWFLENLGWRLSGWAPGALDC